MELFRSRPMDYVVRLFCACRLFPYALQHIDVPKEQATDAVRVLGSFGKLHLLDVRLLCMDRQVEQLATAEPCWQRRVCVKGGESVQASRRCLLVLLVPCVILCDVTGAGAR